MIGAGPHISTFLFSKLRPKLWLTFYAAVWPTAAHAGASSTLDRKRSSFEAKMLHMCVALEGVESLLLEVKLVARLPTFGKKLT